MFSTEVEISTTLSSKLELASDNVEPNFEVSSFRTVSSVFV